MIEEKNDEVQYDEAFLRMLLMKKISSRSVNIS